MAQPLRKRSSVAAFLAFFASGSKYRVPGCWFWRMREQCAMAQVPVLLQLGESDELPALFGFEADERRRRC